MYEAEHRLVDHKIETSVAKLFGPVPTVAYPQECLVVSDTFLILKLKSKSIVAFQNCR